MQGVPTEHLDQLGQELCKLRAYRHYSSIPYFLQMHFNEALVFLDGVNHYSFSWVWG